MLSRILRNKFSVGFWKTDPILENHKSSVILKGENLFRISFFWPENNLGTPWILLETSSVILRIYKILKESQNRKRFSATNTNNNTESFIYLCKLGLCNLSVLLTNFTLLEICIFKLQNSYLNWDFDFKIVQQTHNQLQLQLCTIAYSTKLNKFTIHKSRSWNVHDIWSCLMRILLTIYMMVTLNSWAQFTRMNEDAVKRAASNAYLPKPHMRFEYAARSLDILSPFCLCTSSTFTTTEICFC